MERKAGPRLLVLSPRAPVPESVKGIHSDLAMNNGLTAAATCRRQPVILLKKSGRASARFAEVAGGKTAECAAICCCCPCGLINLLILAVVRLPASLCRRALQKRILHRRSKKKAKLLSSSSALNSDSSSGSRSDTTSGGFSSKVGSASDDEFAEFTGLRGSVVMLSVDSRPVRSPLAEVIEHEKEVWSKLYNSGFWRSLSHKDALTAQVTDC